MPGGFEDPAAKFLPVEEPPGPPAGTPERRRRRPPRGPGVVVVLAGAAICVSVAVVVWFEQPPRSGAPEANAIAPSESFVGEPSGDDTPRIVPRTRTVSIESRPKGAAVFLGDRRLGRTPVTIEAPSTTQILRFEKRGFDAELVEIRPDVGDVMEVRLRRRP